MSASKAASYSAVPPLATYLSMASTLQSRRVVMSCANCDLLAKRISASASSGRTFCTKVLAAAFTSSVAFFMLPLASSAKTMETGVTAS